MAWHSLTFIYHVPFWMENNCVYTEHPAIGRYVESLASQVSSLTIISPRHLDQSSLSYRVQAENIEVSNMPEYRNIQQFWKNSFKYYSFLWKAARNWDLLNIRMPTHIGFPAFLAAKLHNKPIFLVVVGEGLSYSRLNSYPFLKQSLSNLEAYFQDKLMDFMVKNSLTFVNGNDLYQKLNRPGRKVFLMRSSTIKDSDIEQSEKDKCQGAQIKILTVGTISPRKGTSLIPHVIADLKQRGLLIEWSYIGNPDGNSGEQELLRTKRVAVELDVLPQLKFVGSLNWDLLREHYRRSDIFVMPTYMEGIPRVILEAQAAGLPVISTLVGGIPQAVENGKDAILVPPGRPKDIADAIALIIANSQLRHDLITNGITSAKRLTVEAETLKMFNQLNNHLLIDN
jgi:glycosyltransferase involved in cell wall biosynthesis